MHLVELSDAATFLHRSQRLLLDKEAENNLLLSSALTLARAGLSRSPRLSFYIVETSGTTLAAALNVGDRRLLISTAGDESATLMGRKLGERAAKVRGVLGPSNAARCLTDALAETSPLRFTVANAQRVLRLDAPASRANSPLAARAAAPGMFRIAKEKDLPFLREWSFRFVSECDVDEPAEETEDVLRRYLENRQLSIWEDHRPVAMAGFGGFTPNGVRLNMVYTAPEARARGYAGSLVQALSRRLLKEDGRRSCFLFVDAANAAANKVYERLGYQEAGAFSEFRLRLQPESGPHHGVQ